MFDESIITPDPNDSSVLIDPSCTDSFMVLGQGKAYQGMTISGENEKKIDDERSSPFDSVKVDWSVLKETKVWVCRVIYFVIVGSRIEDKGN